MKVSGSNFAAEKHSDKPPKQNTYRVMNNMKTTLSLIITATAVSIASAQEPTDTVKTKDLKEVVVEAQMQKTSSNVTTYYPDKNSKRTAQNAIDLLDRMAIPQINVNPATVL